MIVETKQEQEKFAKGRRIILENKIVGNINNNNNNNTESHPLNIT